MVFGLSSACYNMVLFIVLLHHFICVKPIHTSKAYSIIRIYQTMVINILKNRDRKYSSYYIIKFVGFISIYYTINLDIVSCLMFDGF